MPVRVVDTGVLVELAKADQLALLGGLAPDLPYLVPDEVDAELRKARSSHPDHFARYEAEITAGRIRVETILVGSPAHVEFLRLRGTRTSPQRNRGEDACMALGLVTPGSYVYLKDERARKKAVRELGDPARVKGLADIPGWPPPSSAPSPPSSPGPPPTAPPRSSG